MDSSKPKHEHLEREKPDRVLDGDDDHAELDEIVGEIEILAGIDPAEAAGLAVEIADRLSRQLEEGQH